MKYSILASMADELVKKIKRIVNKCEKEHIDYTFNVSEPYEKVYHSLKNKEETFILDVVDIEVSVNFKYDGWKVLGVVKDDCGVRQCYFDDSENLKKYNNIEFKCDHCKKHAYRKSVIVIEHDNGDVKVVGTSCLKEFTRGLDGDLVLMFNDVESILKMKDIDNNLIKDYDEDDCCEGKGFSFLEEYGKPAHSITKILTLTKHFVNINGYVSKTASMYDTNEVATYIIVQDSYEKYGRLVSEGKITQKEIDFGNDVYNWIKNLDEKTRYSSNYFLNLYNLFQNQGCRTHQYSMVCSAVIAYTKKLEKEKQEMDKPESNHIGNIGDKIEIEVQLEKTISYESSFRYNCDDHIHIMVDKEGNKFIWRTAKSLGYAYTLKNLDNRCFENGFEPIEEGETFIIQGKIKAHTEYKGEKQTELTRCKLIQTEDFIKFVEEKQKKLTERLLESQQQSYHDYDIDVFFKEVEG